MTMNQDQDQTVKNFSPVSRVETNLIRLLKKCEEMAQLLHKEGSNNNNWRLEKYTGAVENMIAELKTGPNQPSRDQMLEYERRNEFIKGLIYTTKLGSTSERAMASQLIKPSVSSAVIQEQMEIKHRNASKYSEDLRKELLGSDEDETDQGFHKQQQMKNINKKEELDDLVKYHHAMQEKIADQMLDLTRSLKDQVSFAGKIVKKDTEILEKSSNTIDQNQSNLKIESTKLETFNKRACKCWVWFLIVLVFSVFISMVLFMRLFRKNIVVLLPPPPPSSS